MIAPSDTETAAMRDARHGRPAGIALGFVVFVMAVVFVLPGFVAAVFSKEPHTIFSMNEWVAWDADFTLLSEPACFRAELIMLAPPARIATRSVAGRSGWVMKHSPPIRRFYNWEYRCARGLDAAVPAGFKL